MEALERLREAYPAAPARYGETVRVYDGAQTRHGTIVGATIPRVNPPPGLPGDIRLAVLFEGDEEPQRIHPLHGVTYL